MLNNFSNVFCFHIKLAKQKGSPLIVLQFLFDNPKLCLQVVFWIVLSHLHSIFKALLTPKCFIFWLNWVRTQSDGAQSPCLGCLNYEHSWKYSSVAPARSGALACNGRARWNDGAHHVRREQYILIFREYLIANELSLKSSHWWWPACTSIRADKISFSGARKWFCVCVSILEEYEPSKHFITKKFWWILKGKITRLHCNDILPQRVHHHFLNGMRAIWTCTFFLCTKMQTMILCTKSTQFLEFRIFSWF